MYAASAHESEPVDRLKSSLKPLKTSSEDTAIIVIHKIDDEKYSLLNRHKKGDQE